MKLQHINFLPLLLYFIFLFSLFWLWTFLSYYFLSAGVLFPHTYVHGMFTTYTREHPVFIWGIFEAFRTRFSGAWLPSPVTGLSNRIHTSISPLRIGFTEYLVFTWLIFRAFDLSRNSHSLFSFSEACMSSEASCSGSIHLLFSPWPVLKSTWH